MPVRAITFDYWGTLFRDENSVPRQEIRICAFAEASGAPRDAVEEALEGVWKEFGRCHRHEQRTLFPRDAVTLASAALDVSLEPDVIDELTVIFATAILEYSPVPIEGAREAVEAAAQYGPIGLISDTGVSPGSSLRTIMDRCGFSPLFAAMTFSDELDGAAKPQRIMYERTAEQLGVRVDELLHIGDLGHTDIAGAQALGAKAALFTGVNAEHIHSCKPHYHFANWWEFIEALPGLMNGKK
jgi:putative hydrolase of the HAD superfamily